MSRIGVETYLGHEHNPSRIVCIERLPPAGVAVLEHAGPRRIPLEVIRIKLYAMNCSAARQTHDRPIVSGTAPPPRLPTISHMC